MKRSVFIAMTKEQMIHEIEAYVNHIVFVQDCLTAYKSLMNAINVDNEKINLSSGFFTIVKYALCKCMLTELSKIYIGSGKEKTLNRLINLVLSNLNLLSKKKKISYLEEPEMIEYVEYKKINIKKEIEKLKGELDEKQEVIERLKGIRDKVLAHNDPQYFNGEYNFYEDYPFGMKETEELLFFAEYLCNIFLDNLDNRVICFKSLNADDLFKLLDKVTLEKR